MRVLRRLLRKPSTPPEGDAAEVPDRRWAGGGGLRLALFVGEIVDAPAEAICTSTNPRLSLGGGTGRAVLEETGWGLKRRLEEIVDEEARRTVGRELPVGFTCATPGGRPPHRLIVHCVANDHAHRSSPEAVRLCVEGALREAGAAGCTSLALPVFGAGHANLPFDHALRAMAEALRDAASSPVDEVLLVILQPDRLTGAARLLDQVLPPA